MSEATARTSRATGDLSPEDDHMKEVNTFARHDETTLKKVDRFLRLRLGESLLFSYHERNGEFVQVYSDAPPAAVKEAVMSVYEHRKPEERAAEGIFCLNTCLFVAPMRKMEDISI